MIPRACPGGSSGPYPAGFVFGRGEARPGEWSLSGLKLSRCLEALAGVRGRVLELGCGGGQYLRALRRLRPDLTLSGVDLDAGAVRESGDIDGVTCDQADVTRLPYKNNLFAAVIGFDILEHVKRPAQVMAEARRVLRPGGILHAYVPCEGNPGTVYQRRGHGPKVRWGGHVQQFTSERLLAGLRAAGFEVVSVRYADYWLTQHLDYLFFTRLDKSKNPERLWAGQALVPGGGAMGWLLRGARRTLSAVAWAEGIIRRGPRGAMGMHFTAKKLIGPIRPISPIGPIKGKDSRGPS